MTRVLLIGGSGQLGTAIRRRWNDCEIAAPSHEQLALERSVELGDALDRFRPDLLVNAAAFHDVDRCEAEPERALEINGVAVGRAAALARERDVIFVTISTDYVFDGAAATPYREDALPHPLSLYGLSKLAGEHLALRNASRVFVVRTCGLYGSGLSRRAFVERVISQPEGAEPMRVVADVVVSPTFAGDLADALRRLVRTEAYGLYHAVNAGAVSWYDFAREALSASESSRTVEPIRSEAWKMPAIRPRYSALANAKLEALSIVMPPWREGLAAYLTSHRPLKGESAAAPK